MNPRSATVLSTALAFLLLAASTGYAQPAPASWGYIVKEYCPGEGYTPVLNTLAFADLSDAPPAAQSLLLGTCQGLLILDATGAYAGKYTTRDDVYSLAAADVTGDGVKEIFLGGPGDVSAVSTAGRLLWTTDVEENVLDLEIVDLDGDGVTELLAASSKSYPADDPGDQRWGSVLLFATDGELLWRATVRDHVLDVALMNGSQGGRPPSIVARGHERLHLLSTKGKPLNDRLLHPPPTTFKAPELADASLAAWPADTLLVADVDVDGRPDAVVVETDAVAFFDERGNLTARVPVPASSLAPRSATLVVDPETGAREIWLSGTGEDVWAVTAEYGLVRKAELGALLRLTSLATAYADLDGDGVTEIIGLGMPRDLYRRLVAERDGLSPENELLEENEPHRIFAYAYLPAMHRVVHFKLSKQYTPRGMEVFELAGIHPLDADEDGMVEVLFAFQDGLLEHRSIADDLAAIEASTTVPVTTTASSRPGIGDLPDLPLPERDFFDQHVVGIDVKVLVVIVVPLVLLLLYAVSQAGQRQEHNQPPKKKKPKKSQLYEFCDPQLRERLVRLDEKIERAWQKKQKVEERHAQGRLTPQQYTNALIDVDYELEDAIDEKQALLAREENQIVFTISDLEQEVSDNRQLDVVYYQTESTRLQELLDEIKAEEKQIKRFREKVLD